MDPLALSDFPGLERRTPPVPLVLVVSCRPSLVELIRLAAEPTDAIVLECDPRSVRALVRLWRPFALVLPRRLLESDPTTYERIALRYRARPVPIEDADASERQLRRELISAVRAVYR